ncbi:hypothetical protein [Streptomyces sp. NPDC059564]|uniref:hypothetical protein n=1 Tax=Streptomyces sp. NPDC059564 TaxID=3346865 RepID=UPI003676F305
MSGMAPADPGAGPPVPADPGRGRSSRAGELAALISAATGVVGLLLGFFGLPTFVNSPTARAVQPTVTATVTVTAAAPSSGSAGSAPSAPLSAAPSTGQGTPVTKTNIQMTDGYAILLSDDTLTPKKGVKEGLGYQYNWGLMSDGGGEQLSRLDPGQAGSLEVCRAETRLSDKIDEEKLTKGTQVCVRKSGHVALATIQAAPQQRDGSHYITLDLTVWP